MLNLHLGGSLRQHLLAGIAHRHTWEVNSRQRQAIARLGTGLQVCARDAEDGNFWVWTDEMSEKLR